jgi:hypothetical protein
MKPRWTLLATLLVLLVAAPHPRAAERGPSVKDVMRRVGAYVDAYGDKASVVVATEEYTQELRSGSTNGRETRRLLADFAIVKVESLGAWWGFRDVLEVDAMHVRDRDDRLVRLLTESAGRYDEARRLSDESARFNIGGIHRNFNVPTTALFFFRSENQNRFKFSAKGVSRDGIWEIVFRETSKPTLIRTPTGQSVISKGSIWVNPADGTIVRTLLEVDGFVSREGRRTTGTGRVDVQYRRVPELDMWLPEWMDEEFHATRADETEMITGRAWYSKYRRFQTSIRIK